MGSASTVSSSLRAILQGGQDDSVPIGKSVAKLRNLWETLGESEASRRALFDRLMFYLQLPLASKERTPYVDRVLEVACRFAASFLKDKESGEVKAKDDSMDTTDDFVDLPPLMHWLIDWLLDHHEVEKKES